MWGDYYVDLGVDLIDGGFGVDTIEDWSIFEDFD